MLKKLIAFIIAVSLAANVGLYAFADSNALRIIVPEAWEMCVGESRSLDYAFASGKIDGALQWSADPEDVAKVDKWGRVTALKEGTARITAKVSSDYGDSVTLTVVSEPTKFEARKTKNDYAGTARKEAENLQKIVTRYTLDHGDVPEELRKPEHYPDMQIAVTADGAKWEITSYGVLRTDKSAANERDREQRFMGNRYFYSSDTADGKVLAVFPDGKNGIWTVMAEGYTHIEMVDMSGEKKAADMSRTTQQYVARRGMVSDARFVNGQWTTHEDDNDGLWTSMYGAGELMRYAVLRDDPSASEEEVAEARKNALLSTEAMLLLTYISMREGTTEAYVKAQRNGSTLELNTGKYYSEKALIKDGDYSQNMPYSSPAAAFEKMKRDYAWIIKKPSYIMSEDNLKILDPQSWSDPAENPDAVYEKRTRTLEGFWARTYSFKDESEWWYLNENNVWSMNGDGTATNVSTKDILINGENMRGAKVNATGTVPERLWHDLIGSGYSADDIIYRGDTSADEIIGHLFIYKLAYDILGAEDAEIRYLISETMNSFAKHLTDNGYNLCEGTGQPTTWGKFSRSYFSNGSVLAGVPLQASVVLCVFKLAAYVTGYEKWENEYRMAAFDPQYEYAEAMTQKTERYEMAMAEYAASVHPILGHVVDWLSGTSLYKMLYRMILNYSDEEMAMLSFYLLFQLEDDERLLSTYREALDDWWISISYGENPLWYYIYQLAYLNKTVKDSYGNNILDTAAWSLSRHPIDTVRHIASNNRRDDIAVLDLTEGRGASLTYDKKRVKLLWSDSEDDAQRIAGVVLCAPFIKWAIAAPDEKAMHKYNTSPYKLEAGGALMESSTTYTLPYWMGRYHGMLEK